MIDDFREVSGWLPVASGLAQLAIASEAQPGGAAMRLDFDFKGGGGFVVARREVALTVPETYVVSFRVQGDAPPNKLELKLSDPSGRNVWWWHRDAFEFSADATLVSIRSTEIEFAWGPASGGTLTQIGAIEIAIVAGPGGKGTVWISDLDIEDRSYRAIPVVSASSQVAGHEPARVLAPGAAETWRTKSGNGPHWIEIDFQTDREYGGLVIDWEAGRAAAAFDVQTSNDGRAWTTVYSAPTAGAERSYAYMPATCARYLRFDLLAPVSTAGFGIAAIKVQPFEFSRSIEGFFQHVATMGIRGSYPKYFSREQTYWSPVGVADGTTCALLNQEGMVEVDKGGFSIEPVLGLDDLCLSWADVEPTQELEGGCLPIPSSVWRADAVVFRTTAFATRVSNDPVLFIRYRVENGSPRARSVRVCAVIRPFQVTPPWQMYQGMGGVHRIDDLAGDGQFISVNGRERVFALTDGGRFGAMAFAQGSILDALRGGTLPEAEQVHDAFGFASGALMFELAVGPHASGEVYLAIPFTDDLPMGIDGAGELARAIAGWESKLGATTFTLPPTGQVHADTFRTAAAHVLVCRDGAALQPGPRRYTRSWVRDGAIMAAALLRAGHVAEAVEFVRWYAPFQAENGAVPCCVDRNGPDWLVEHDSHGELIYAVMECYRFTGDRDFLRDLWPAVLKAAEHIEMLRNTRVGPEFESGERRACYGLLPESASHEGYLAQPVHAYWDDFWAVRGLGDAIAIAEAVGERMVAARFRAVRDAMQASLAASIDVTIAERKIDYVPGSVEWADFDPTATANAISLLDALPHLPRPALDRTFDIYLEGFRKRVRNEIDWANYTPYEVRIVGALVHLGRRDDANELLDYLLGDRRPPVWNQWPEIAWRNPNSPGHLGDLPHCWIGAEYMLALRTMLVFENLAERVLVIGAGVPAAWLDDDGVSVRDLPTYFGPLSFTLRRLATGEIQLTLTRSMMVPIALRPPLSGGLRRVEVDGQTSESFDAASAWIDPGSRAVTLWSAPD